jgi:outer membrane protein insertion porin family
MRRLEYQTFAGENIQGYIDDRRGVSFLTGVPVGRWSRFFVNYAYEWVEILASETPLDPNEPPTTTNPIFQDDLGKRRESRLTPSMIFNSVDNPWTPRSGVKLAATFQVAGGPLGGTLSYLKPNFEAIWYIPHFRRTALGLRAEIGYLRPFGETAEIFPETGQNGLPFYLRYYMGGETQIRGYNIRSVGPRDRFNNILGGNKFLLFNAEYYVDIAGPLRFLFFFDAGQAYLENQSFDLSELRTSTGGELRFIMPVLNVPFRLIYAWNPHRDDFQPATAFKFAVGTTF